RVVRVFVGQVEATQAAVESERPVNRRARPGDGLDDGQVGRGWRGRVLCVGEGAGHRFVGFQVDRRCPRRYALGRVGVVAVDVVQRPAGLAVLGHGVAAGRYVVEGFGVVRRVCQREASVEYVLGEAEWRVVGR